MARGRGKNNLDAVRQHFLNEHIKIVCRPGRRGEPAKVSATVYATSQNEVKTKEGRCSHCTVYAVLYCPKYPGC